MSTIALGHPDLTQHPPRSARVKIGGYVILARMIDKCRATLGGKNGEYHYNCPLDQRLLTFAGVSADAFQAAVASGLGDGDLLAWIEANSSTKPADWQIDAWSAGQASRGPSDPDSRSYFNGIHTTVGAKREDISTWFELLDLDDYVSYGGKA